MFKNIRNTFFLFVMCAGFLTFYTNPLQAQVVRTHLVQPLDNYYSISLKYDISIDDLKKANPDILNPKPGDVLIIPVFKTEDEIPEATDCGRLRRMAEKDKLYRVALMIPFYLEKAQYPGWSQKVDMTKIYEHLNFRFIQFYHGFMMAADSLKKTGLDVEIHVYDIDQQSSKVLKALRDPALKKADLIVGPFFKNSFDQVAEFAKQHKIPIINPLSSRSDILESNPFVYKTLPSLDSQPEAIAKLVRRDFPNHNVIIYTANKYQGAALVSRLKNALETSLSLNSRPVYVVDYATDSVMAFMYNAVFQQPNLIIIYAEDEVVPAALLSKLSALRNDYPMTIIGLPEWEKFSNLESVYMVVLNAHILTSAYVDTDNEIVRNFIMDYRARYYDEPMNYAFMGFDTGIFFLQALMIYGKDFGQCLDDLRIPLIQNDFDFSRPKLDGGFENTFWQILKYDGYKLVNRSAFY